MTAWATPSATISEFLATVQNQLRAASAPASQKTPQIVHASPDKPTETTLTQANQGALQQLRNDQAGAEELVQSGGRQWLWVSVLGVAIIAGVLWKVLGK